MGADYNLQLILPDQPCKIHADPKLLQQCISHLVLNAAQSMPNQGRVTIEVSRVFMQRQIDAFQQTILPQEYVKIAVADSGKGMTKTHLSFILTPFLSTQKPMTAKGLGLSLIYSFIKKNNAYCLVNTDVDKGSSFSLLFKII
jgi:two-component system cell cycle sensor histidine kinase/response regulator CckA